MGPALADRHGHLDGGVLEGHARAERQLLGVARGEWEFARPLPMNAPSVQRGLQLGYGRLLLRLCVGCWQEGGGWGAGWRLSAKMSVSWLSSLT